MNRTKYASINFTVTTATWLVFGQTKSVNLSCIKWTVSCLHFENDATLPLHACHTVLSWRTEFRSFQVGPAAEPPFVPADLIFEADIFIYTFCFVRGFLYLIVVKMGCAGFTCSKHSLCALNILYVVSIHSRIYHMVYHPVAFIRRYSVFFTLSVFYHHEGNVLF